MLSRKTFWHFSLNKNLEATPFAFTFSKSSFRLFSVEIPSWMGFSRPQLVVVSGLFRWESLDGWDFLGHNLLLFQASFSRWNSGYHEAFLTNFFFFHDGILAIREPFSRTFSFFTMEFLDG
jgi:hypothetical protein